MPNWCRNEVEIYSSDKETLSEIKKAISSKESSFDFNKILPMPKELKGTVSGSEDAKPEWQKTNSKELKEKHGADNWYNWCVENWGCKWNAQVEDVNDEGDYIIYYFDTPWSPPTGVYEKLKETYPDIDISWFYREEGMQFAGYLNTEYA